MSNEEKKPCEACPQKVDALIQNEYTPWTDEDKEELLTMSEKHIDKLVVQADYKPEPPETNEEDPPKPVEITKEQAMETLKGAIQNDEDLYSLLSPELAATMRQARDDYKAKRSELINKIAANSDFEEEELKDKNVKELQKMEAMLPKPKNFIVQGGDQNIGSEPDLNKLLLPAGVKVFNKKGENVNG